jgi:hypothetical protein
MKTIILTIIITLLFTISGYAGEITKNQSYHHSVTENGNIQVRMVTEYLDDGKIVDVKYGQPMTPANTGNMTGWDQKSKDIVTAITDKDVEAAFDVEHKVATGVGLETIVTYDRVVDDLGRISVRQITRIYDDGEMVSKKFHRSWIMPGDDPSKFDVMSKALAIKIHTQGVIDAYNASKTN